MLADSFSRRTFPSFDNLVFKRKNKRLGRHFLGARRLGFSFRRRKKARRTILERSISPILTVLILRVKNKMLGRQFFVAWRFCFSCRQRILPTDNFEDDFWTKLDKILRTMILEKYNERNEWLAANKNYMQVWRRRACVAAFSHQLCIGRQWVAPKSSPAYSSVR